MEKEIIRFCAISDIHGNLNFDIKECDCLLICGDIVSKEAQSNTALSKRYYKKEFIPWCIKQPCENVIIIAGNHDKYLDTHNNEFIEKVLKKVDKKGKIIYLPYDEEFGGTMVNYYGCNIYGTPMCSIFGNWSFQFKHDEQIIKFSNMIKRLNEENKKIDIIMSHDAPYGTSDVLEPGNPFGTTLHCGNTALKNFMQVTQPSILLHGHLHSTNHKPEIAGETFVYNVSLLDDKYNMKYKPFYFTYEQNP